MRRTLRACFVVSLVVGASPLTAQVASGSDSTAAAALPRPDTMERRVRVSSRHLPFEMRDIMMMNCTYLSDSDDVMTWVIPYACMRRMTGTLSRIDADSVVFLRNGRLINLPMRQVNKVERYAGRSAWRARLGGVFGGLTGLVFSAMAGIGGAYGDNDGAFVATAFVLTAGGAVIGSRRAGTMWSELPYAPVKSHAPIAPAEQSRDPR